MIDRIKAPFIKIGGIVYDQMNKTPIVAIGVATVAIAVVIIVLLVL